MWKGICASFWVLIRISQSLDPTGQVVDAIDDDADAAKGCRAAASTTDKPNVTSWNLQQHVRLTENQSNCPIKDPKLVRTA